MTNLLLPAEVLMKLPLQIIINVFPVINQLASQKVR